MHGFGVEAFRGLREGGDVKVGICGAGVGRDEGWVGIDVVAVVGMRRVRAVRRTVELRNLMMPKIYCCPLLWNP